MNYWLVGAKFGGNEEVLDVFLKRGYWYCWDLDEDDIAPGEFKGGNSKARQLKSFNEIKPLDRIAVKRLCGQASANMRILAIGVVKDIDFDEHRVYVDWIAVSKEIAKENFEYTPRYSFEDRVVELGGCVSSIHGPYSLDSSQSTQNWLQKIFCI